MRWSPVRHITGQYVNAMTEKEPSKSHGQLKTSNMYLSTTFFLAMFSKCAIETFGSTPNKAKVMSFIIFFYKSILIVLTYFYYEYPNQTTYDRTEVVHVFKTTSIVLKDILMNNYRIDIGNITSVVKSHTTNASSLTQRLTSAFREIF